MTLARITLSAAAITLAGVGMYVFPAEQSGIRRVQLQRHDLAAAGYEVVQVRVEFDAGAAFGRHRHPGDEIVNVLEGSLEYVLEGQTPVVLKAGDVLVVPSGVIHSARNVGRKPGAELATYIVRKGEPIVELTD